MKSDQTKLWENKFGDEYQKRNVITDKDLIGRNILWGYIISKIHEDCSDDCIPSYCEFGAGQGQNLIAIDNIYKHSSAKHQPALVAVEPNEAAYNELLALSINVTTINKSIEGLHPIKPLADVAFTSGLLIHIDPKNLLDAMNVVYKSAAKYVVCTEYFSATQRDIPYRGVDKSLWSNDFGGLYLDNFPLRCLGYAFFWKRITGLDNLTVWIFKKTD